MATPHDISKGRSQAQRVGDLARERDRVSAELMAAKKLLGKIREAAFNSPDIHDGYAAVRQLLADNWDAATPPGKAFDLVRYQDRSGVSGAGRVAEGYEFEDGTAVMRWLSGSDASTNTYASVESIVRIHGHGGSTEVVFR